MFKKNSFKIKLTFSYVLLIAVSFVFVVFFLDRNLGENSLRDIRFSLVSQARLIEDQISPERLKQRDTAYLEALTARLSSKIDGRITIIDREGKVLAESRKSHEEISGMENHLYRPEIRDALTGLTGIDTRYSSTLKMDMLYVALPIKQNDDIAGVLRLALPLENVERTLSAVRKIILLGLFLALGVAFILGSLLASQTIKPINRMIHVSRKFSEGDFSRRIIQHSGDEIGELAATLNKMAQDIEDKIREIEVQNQKLAAIFNSMIEGVIVVDGAGRIMSINPTIEKMFGLLKKDVQGKAFLEAIRNNDIAEIIKSVLGHGRPLSTEITLVYPVHRIFEVNTTPIFGNEAVNGCLVVIHDITEMRRLETIRSDFVANVSHELKTPLTSIKGFVETLLEGALDDKKNNRNFLAIIQDHADRLDRLVDDLLSLSHLESKEIVLQRDDCNLYALVEKAIPGFASQSKKKNIEIKNELPEGLSLKVDRARIEQVFVNLIDNGIKFNKDKGFVRICGRVIDDKVHVSVEDSGIGIPQKDIPRIFERFYRVDKARSRELGGTGLGLSIVRHIVELHGGHVGVESTEGFGSKFWFTLPA
ncbi:MAG: ATP-binding protein [Candidatus Omnitrophica bacterium]|nr:ATP-binding protein [Candidatus Omnitrophota bacterium]